MENKCKEMRLRKTDSFGNWKAKKEKKRGGRKERKKSVRG